MSAVLPLLDLLPAAGALGLLVAGRERGERIARPLGVAVAGLTTLLAVLATGAAVRTRGFALQVDTVWVRALGVHAHLGIDGISAPLVLLTAVLVLCGLVYTWRVLPEPGRARELVGLILVLESGALGTFTALDLLLFFVAFETVLVPMWFIVAVWGDPHDPVARRGAATTFILYTALGSAVMLAGLLLVGLRAGTFDMTALTAMHGAGLAAGTQVVAVLAIGLGLAVKTPMWPLHTWLPGAHTAAPTVGSVLLAGVLLKMGTYGLVRIVVPILPAGARAVFPWLGVLAVVGILHGALACLGQRDLKRLVAYSSVGHMGFVLFGIATLTPVGINGALYANVAHGVVTGLLFFLVGSLKDRFGSVELSRLGGLYATHPRIGGLLALAAVASLGLPGLVGFWGEMLALLGAYQAGTLGWRLLMVAAGAGAVLTTLYFLRMLRRVAQQPRDPLAGSVPPGGGPLDPRSDVTGIEVASFSPLVLATVVLGLAPWVLLGLTDPVVRLLTGGA